MRRVGNFLIPLGVALSMITGTIAARNFGIPKVDRPVEYVIVHHTAGNEKTVEQIRKAHLQRKFKDIAYHYVIFPDGKIETGRNIDKRAAGVYGHSGTTIEMVLVGELHKNKVPRKQWDSATMLAAKIIKQYNLPYWRVKGHNEHAIPGHSTLCPGFKDLRAFRIQVDKDRAYLKGVEDGENGKKTNP